MTNRYVILFCLFLSAFAANAQTARTTSGNPIFPGWYADPEATIFGKTYWIYPTYSDKYEKQTFMDAFSSNDLITWTKHPRIVDTTNIKWAKKALWAPAVVEKKGKYYLFFGANDVHEGEVGGIGVAVANSPAGPFKDLLGKPLIGHIYNKAQPIDQFVFRDKDGKEYLIYGGWGHCNIAQLKPDYTGFIPFPDGSTFREITPQDYVEGPIMFIRKGQYYFMWSEGGWTGPNYSVAYAVADSPFGPFRRVGKILQQDPTVATGAGHHSVINVPGTDEWYIVYHRRPLTETDGNHRETCIDRMYFDEKGQILPVKITKEGVAKRVIGK
ncbi:glycoside hydrolase family 43 protein [Fibrella sp. HMF5335]|uniref:Glycoside hydrolase family 43 protein n=1 Tax=Fibrella rubiginis TaxID=2817060 RepID=A0A939GAV6_9BACT|nr:glycoside hydrolase family 43 protein [Fibrella rubiginis]MBO0935652.1 glycoside hydrolase family 43 protein [Fibrella rubiginis]